MMNGDKKTRTRITQIARTRTDLKQEKKSVRISEIRKIRVQISLVN